MLAIATFNARNRGHQIRPLFFFAIGSVLIASVCFQIAELGELAKIAFGSSGVKTKVTDYLFCGEFILIGHKFQNIDQFLCQRRLYRPFQGLLALAPDQKEQQNY